MRLDDVRCLPLVTATIHIVHNHFEQIMHLIEEVFGVSRREIMSSQVDDPIFLIG